MKKILIIRFSSFGDIIQAISATRELKNNYPFAEISWITRGDFSGFLEAEPSVDKVIKFERKNGLTGLITLSKKLCLNKYDLIYDAHNNLRSNVMKIVFAIFSSSTIITRPKDRIKRLLFFKFRINKYQNWPFKGVISFLEPLKKVLDNSKISKLKDREWCFKEETKNKVIKLLSGWDNFITIVPSAAWPVKRWPVSYWQDLIKGMPNQKFVIIAGPRDKFTEEITEIAPERVLNLSGKLNLLESAYIISLSAKVVSGDTGFLHVADLFQKKTVALIGPTAFGYPSGKNVKVIESNLPCKPCTKDGSNGCKHKIYQKCMLNIKPKTVINALIKNDK